MIPESLLQKEKDHVEGFAPEVAWVTHGGLDRLEERMCVRPTSETLFCDFYKKDVQSYRDLPKVYNQWCSVVRWEKTTRPFLRTREFLWQEGHTAHATAEQAEERTEQMLNLYADFAEDFLAIPVVRGQKTEKEKFAGAVATYSIEALMHDGKALQSGTTHYLGTGFAKAADIEFLGRDQKLNTPHQTSWGVSTRLLGALIMVHGDDNGLVLPPRVAPIQTVIIPIRGDKVPAVMEECHKLLDELTKLGVRAEIDETDHTPGWKFAEWEMKGVPLRIEIGPRDLENGNMALARRYNGAKDIVPLSEIEKIPAILEEIQAGMFEKAKDYLAKHIKTANSWDELKTILDEGGYARMMWHEDEELEMKVKEVTNGGTARCLPFNEKPFGDTCPLDGKPADRVIYFAKAY
jgi:prolyl-tRNA synthetase